LSDTYPDIYLRAIDPAAPPLADSFRAKSTVQWTALTPLAITLHGRLAGRPLWQLASGGPSTAPGHVGQRAGAHSGCPLAAVRVDTGRPAPGISGYLPEGVTGVDGPWVSRLHNADSDAAHFIMNAHD